MRKFTLLAFIGFLFWAGCGFEMPAPTPDAPDMSDIRSWDFSPCLNSWEAFNTCKDLLKSNQEVILGGHTFIDVLFYNLAPEVKPVEEAASTQPSA